MSRIVGVVIVLVGLAIAPLKAGQSGTYTAEEQRNLEVVRGFWKNVFLARDATRARDYLAENYNNHNPVAGALAGGGVNGFIQFLSMFGGRGGGAAGAPQPDDAVMTMVDGDIVTLLRRQMAPDPTNPADQYEAFSFEMYRVRDGKIVEHWDGARRLPPGQMPAPQGGRGR